MKSIRNNTFKKQDKTNLCKKIINFKSKENQNPLSDQTAHLQLSVKKDIKPVKKLINSLNNNKCIPSHQFQQVGKDQSGKQNQNQNIRKFREYKEQYPSQQQQIINLANSSDNNQMIISKSLKGKKLSEATLSQLNQNHKQRKRIYPLLVASGYKLINYQDTKCSKKSNGIISSYAANTNQGISRNYNQDRVSIILNITKSNVKCSIFAIYDGHGGNLCCDYLRDSLHQYIINNQKFPQHPKEAIIQGIKKAEENFLQHVYQLYKKQNKLDRSGSCAIIVLIIKNQCYVINIGDSRAIMSVDEGKYAYNLSRDHKPTQIQQQKRIQQNGGKIYRTQIKSLVSKQSIFGPLRVYPGKLSVSRTIGDIEAKFQKFGGNNKVVIACPEIKHFQIKLNQDFIILGCDGIFDKLQSKDIVKMIWLIVQQYKEKPISIHKLCSICVQEILREVMNRRSIDNLTIVMIAFNSFEAKLNKIWEGINKQIASDDKKHNKYESN